MTSMNMDEDSLPFFSHVCAHSSRRGSTSMVFIPQSATFQNFAYSFQSVLTTVVAHRAHDVT